MNLKFYKDYFKRCRNEISSIAKKEDVQLIYLGWDFIKCSIAHGAILNHYCRGGLYQLKGCERRKAMTYGRILKVYKICNNINVRHLLENKAHFNTHFSNLVTRKWILSQESSFDDFQMLCGSCDALIVKPFDGVNGANIIKVHVPGDEAERKRMYDGFAKDNLIVEECVKQHPALCIGGRSVNTIRAFTVMDRSGEVHILKTLLRVGVGDSVVDNYSTGGCVYEVDPSTGIVITPSLTKKGETVYIHPGTDFCMLGFRIPNWEVVMDSLVSAQKQIPENRFTGWDVAVTEHGVEFIEGNHNPGYELLEFFGTKGWYNRVKPFL